MEHTVRTSSTSLLAVYFIAIITERIPVNYVQYSLTPYLHNRPLSNQQHQLLTKWHSKSTNNPAISNTVISSDKYTRLRETARNDNSTLHGRLTILIKPLESNYKSHIWNIDFYLHKKYNVFGITTHLSHISTLNIIMM